jgi:Amt family ammonium transporter
MVFFMQIGFSMLEVGSVQAKSTKNVLVKNAFDVCLSSLSWALVGHALAFGRSNSSGVLGGNGGWALFAAEDPSALDYAQYLFQWAFVSTACTIVSGAVAERINFRVYFVLVLLLCLLVYPVVVHWIWSDDGFMSASKNNRLFGCGVIDFAGSGG